MTFYKAAYVFHEHKVDSIPNLKWKHSIMEYNLHNCLTELFSYAFWKEPWENLAVYMIIHWATYTERNYFTEFTKSTFSRVNISIPGICHLGMFTVKIIAVEGAENCQSGY